MCAMRRRVRSSTSTCRPIKRRHCLAGRRWRTSTPGSPIPSPGTDTTSAPPDRIAAMARVLVGVMTRNRLRYVRETVMSILQQTFTDFRLIVSENPTNPEAARELREWLASLHDQRVEYVLQPVDGGEYGQGRYLAEQL